MDRNGKKPKAVPDPSLHPERSDTKSAARDTPGLSSADARLERERAGRSATTDGTKAQSKGGRR